MSTITITVSGEGKSGVTTVAQLIRSILINQFGVPCAEITGDGDETHKRTNADNASILEVLVKGGGLQIDIVQVQERGRRRSA